MDHAISEHFGLLFSDMVISLRVSITKCVIHRGNLETTEIYSSYLWSLRSQIKVPTFGICCGLSAAQMQHSHCIFT